MKPSTLIEHTGAVLVVGLVFIATSCRKNPPGSMAPVGLSSAETSVPSGSAAESNMLSGRGTEMPAYYDSSLFNINFTELPAGAENALLVHNKSINHIYEMDPDRPGDQPFAPVLDAIQGDGFNPLWVEVEITFNKGFTPRQFYSDNEVLAAASGAEPEITLTTTTEIYRCSVLGPK